MRTTLLALAALFSCACGAAPAHVDDAARQAAELDDAARHDAELAVAAVLDDWHAAAAAADEERYFGHLADDAVFLGTDATERWTKPEFRAYSHPHFARGRAWTFHAVQRHVAIDPEGRYAWFDEELATESLGPARGSGVLRLDDGRWRIVHYDLSLTIPNERFAEVHALLMGDAAPTIDGTPIPDTIENRAVIAAIERYRAAYVAHDVDAIIAMISPRYHDPGHTPARGDDTDADAVRALWQEARSAEPHALTIRYHDLRRTGDEIHVEATCESTVAGEQLRFESTFVLEHDAGGYRFLAGVGSRAPRGPH